MYNEQELFLKIKLWLLIYDSQFKFYWYTNKKNIGDLKKIQKEWKYL